MTSTVGMRAKTDGLSEEGDTIGMNWLQKLYIGSITFGMSYEIFSILTINKKFYKDSGEFYGFFAEKEY